MVNNFKRKWMDYAKKYIQRIKQISSKWFLTMPKSKVSISMLENGKSGRRVVQKLNNQLFAGW